MKGKSNHSDPGVIEPAGEVQEIPVSSNRQVSPGQYDREKKLREILDQDGDPSPWTDPFMGF